ncbi:porin [Alteriqipengyuania sp. 357]
MKKSVLIAGGALLLVPGVAAAQPGPAAAADSQRDATIEELRAEVETLRAQVDALIAANAPARAGQAADLPSPERAGATPAVTFEPRGRLQLDAGWIGRPDGTDDAGLGFGTEIRRARLGAEGKVGRDFGYRLEVDMANSDVELADAYINWTVGKSVSIKLGQHNSFQSLEELTSSRFTSFMERAAFTDAFGFERRVGASMTYKSGAVIASGGVFSANTADLSDDEDAVSADARLVYAPLLGASQLHFGASFHHRDLSGERAVRYRQRPFLHLTDRRFVATPALAIESETSFGAELAVIRGPFHAVGEAHWLTADRASGEDPTFFGGYVEAGYFLTGETRGYKAGTFARTKPARSLSEGGAGALQVNLRYDRLDLNDGAVLGGTQDLVALGLTWNPEGNVRFLVNYGHLIYENGPVAVALGRNRFASDTLAMRAQVDF